MDWPATIAISKDIILGFAGITGALVAIIGLSAWRRQLKGQVEYDLARRILTLTFQHRDAIDKVRNPTFWNYEMPEPPSNQSTNMSAEQIRSYGLSKSYEKRWEGVTETRKALYPDLLESEALWGSELVKHFDVLFKLESELGRYIGNYLHISNPDTPRHESLGRNTEAEA